MKDFKKLKQSIIKLLKKDDRIWNEEKTELNQTLLLDLIDKIDEKVINLLLQEKETRNKFFVKIKDVYVFKTNEFKFFMEENKVDNSYTIYKNKIGLTDGKRFLKDTNDVVLNFPRKDCVLEGGQSTEEGMDNYFEYSKKLKSYEKKESQRKEIFFNQILAKDEIDRLRDEKALVNWKRYTKDGKQEVKKINRNENGTIKDNLVIKGNNLLALHSLKKEFAGKVKLIYIDPPYNTGSDSFSYNDSFNHSTWLTFMKNRLEIAKELLKDDGIICIQCDDSEQAYLKVLLDEVMGRDQFETSFYVQVRYDNKTLTEDNDFQKVMEIVHVYSKRHRVFVPNKLKEEYSLDKFKFEVKELKKGETVEVNGKKVEIFKEGQYLIKEVPSSIKALKETWATGSLIRQGGTAAEFLSKYLIKRKDGLNILYKVYDMGNDGLGHRYITGPKKKESFRGKFYTGVPEKIKESVLRGDYRKEKAIPNLLFNYLSYEGDFGNCRHEGGVNIRGGKKPEALILSFIEYFTKEGDLVLDYHLGSGTTCAVAHKMGRQYIGIEQLDYGKNDSVVRLKNVINGDQSGISKAVNWKGGGEFIYCELAKWNEQAKEKILVCKNLKELEKLFDTLYEKYFLNYNLKIKEFKEKVIKEAEFKSLSLNEQKKMFLTMLDLNQMYVNKTEMADKKFNISKEDQELTSKFYGGKD
jgi:adenine-specific DNA-methyltransferase